jgi:hypothetical protein
VIYDVEGDGDGCDDVEGDGGDYGYLECVEVLMNDFEGDEMFMVMLKVRNR